MNREWLLLVSLFSFISYFSLCVYDLNAIIHSMRHGEIRFPNVFPYVSVERPREQP